MKNTEGVPCGRGLEAPENIISKSDYFASYCKHSNSLISPASGREDLEINGPLPTKNSPHL